MAREIFFLAKQAYWHAELQRIGADMDPLRRTRATGPTGAAVSCGGRSDEGVGR